MFTWLCIPRYLSWGEWSYHCDCLHHEDFFFFLYSSVHSCHFLISSASVRCIPFLSFIAPMFAWNVPLLSLIFLKRSLVFPLLLSSSIIKHCLLKKAFLSLLAILWNSAFNWIYLSLSPLLLASFHSSALHKASSDNHFAFSLFLNLWNGFVYCLLYNITDLLQMVKNLPAMQETWVECLGWEDPLGKGMTTHISILAWKIPWTEEPGGLQSMGSQSRTRRSISTNCDC